MGKRLRRLVGPLGRFTFNGKMLIALILFWVGLYMVGIYEGLRLDNPLMMYIPLSLASFLLPLIGVVLFVRSDLRLPQWSLLNPKQMTPWYVGLSPIAIATFNFPLSSFPLFFPTTSWDFRSYWSLLIDGIVLALAAVLLFVFWIRRRWLIRRGPAASASANQPNEALPRVSRRTLLVGGVIVGLELAGVGWFISKLPTLIPQQTFRVADNFEPFPLIAWASDGRRLVGLGDDGALTVWDATTGATLQRLPIIVDNLLGYVWSPDGAQIAIGSVSNDLGAAAEIQLWDVSSQRITQTYRDSYAQPQTSPTVFWQGSRVGFLTSTTASGKAVADIYLWDALTNTNRKLATTQIIPATLVFSPDGRYLAAMDGIGTLTETQVLVLDALTGRPVTTHTFVKRDEIDTMRGLAWSPDGRRLAVGASYNRANVVDALTGAHRQTLQGPLDSSNKFPDLTSILSLSWSPDSRYVAVASDDTTVRIWRDMPDGEPATAFVWAGHLAPVNTVVWSPTGDLIASQGANREVQIWRPQGDLWGA